MSTEPPRNKGKRPRTSSNESNSFVKNMTSRVSGLLPATITKWFSSPSSSNANGSTPAADATDSSTEEESSEHLNTSPVIKRMRLSPSRKPNHLGSKDSNCVPTITDKNEVCTPSTSQSPAGRITFRKEPKYTSTIKFASNDESVIEKSERDTSINNSQHTVSNVGQSVATKRKSLFDSPSNREASLQALKSTASNTVVDPKAPCFRPNLFGSTFYPGQTMYGGASTSTYINRPYIRQRKVAKVNESTSSDTTAMSHSARCVMDLLENYSSPLVDAKRIAQLTRGNNSSSSSQALNNTTISSSPYERKVLSYKTQELHVPTIANILRLKQRSRLMNTTNAARQIIASHSSTAVDQLHPTVNAQKDQVDGGLGSSKLTTKVKNRLTRPKRGEGLHIEEETSAPVNLPTAVLQIDKDNLPKFTFGIPATKPITSTPQFTATNAADKPQTSFKYGGTDSCKPTPISNNDLYKFSSPVRISSEQMNISTTPPKFTFGSPERGIDKPKPDNNKKDDSPSYVVGQPKVAEKIPVQKSAVWTCPDCWVSNKQDANNCVCCGAKQPSKELAKLPKCTICKLADSQANSEKCINCDKVQLNNNMKSSFVPVNATKWKCDDCWVSNDENAEKCVCCGAKNPKASSAGGGAVASADSEWKCDTCWIKNKASDDKCAACSGPRPGAKPPTSVTITPANDFGSSLFRTDNLKNIAKAQSDKWECTSCLVRNENNVTKCVCCDADKPGTIRALDKKKSFNFGSVTATSFKFGLDPKTQETSATKPAEIKFGDGSAKPEESETNNNIYKNSANRPISSVFGAFAKNVEDKTDAATEKKAESPKTGFKFGMPSTSPLPGTTPLQSVLSPGFGAPSKSIAAVPEINNPRIEFKVSSELPKASTFKSPVTLGTGAFESSVTPVTDEMPQPEFAAPTKSKSDKNAPIKFKLPSETPKTLFASPVTSNTDSEAQKEPISGIDFKLQTQTPKVSSFASLVTSTPLIFSSQASKSPLVLSPIGKDKESSNKLLPNSEPQQSAPTFTGLGLGASQDNLFANQALPVAPVLSTPSFSASMQPPSNTLFQKQEPAVPSSMFMAPTAATVAQQPPAANSPIFSFGTNSAPTSAPTPAPNPASNLAPQQEKPKFNFSFSKNTPAFNNAVVPDNSNGNMFSASKLTSNETSASANLFTLPTQKENLWSNNNSSNLFSSNTSTDAPKPAFTFGASSPAPFNANTAAAAPAFGINSVTPQNNATPAFGSSATPSQNMFGMNQGGNAQPSMLMQNQAAPSMFGSSQPAASPAPAMNMFGSANTGSPLSFGNASFEASRMVPSPAPAFNFGAPQPTNAVFGFGQQGQAQQQPQQPQQAGVYSFGAAPGAPQVQFNMGSAPSTAVRRVRKAFRRNPQR